MTHDQDKIKEAAETCYAIKDYLDDVREILELTDSDGDVHSKLAEIREHAHQLAILLEGKL